MTKQEQIARDRIKLAQCCLGQMKHIEAQNKYIRRLQRRLKKLGGRID